MKREQSKFKSIAVSLVGLFLAAGCTAPATAQKAIEFSDEQVENIVRRSYPYVALYNVNNKFALDTSSPMAIGGWNKMRANTTLADHTFQAIARPNNDTLYLAAMIDVRQEPMILAFPSFDSKYVSLMVTAYDHYVNIPLSTTKGDFAKPSRILFYSQRTPGYRGDPVPGVDRAMELTGDFVSAVVRVMPHDNDQALLAAYKPLGVEPGKVFDPDTVAQIDGQQFRQVAQAVAREALAKLGDPSFSEQLTRIFLPKGEMDQELLVDLSVIGPIGQPAREALYPPITTADGKPMNAMHDYVIRMDAKSLPPTNAFWSLTLYDTENGFFIPNDSRKYSVGENAGMKLNAQGGIEIHVSAEKPDGVPPENWLPVNRGDYDIDLLMRIYAPDLKRFKTWSPPKVERIKAGSVWSAPAEVSYAHIPTTVSEKAAALPGRQGRQDRGHSRALHPFPLCDGG